MTIFANIPVPARRMPRHLWAVLLAGGDGIRLRDLTVRIVGDNRPKQFCPIPGAASLLSQTRARLDPLFPGDRQVFVVSCAHERYYSKELADAKDSLVIAQPLNRGTAVGIIVALVQVMQADPDAIVGFFPCDHHYSDDQSFRSIVRSATSSAEQFPGSLVIVGAEAEYAETEYGWIEPGLAVLETQAKSLCRVNRFWEKPALSEAQALLQSGCLWNTFVTIGSAATFLELVCSEVPDVVLSVTRALADNDLAPPTHGCQTSTFRATSWPIRRKGFWCFEILARDGPTLVALTGCSGCLPKTLISRPGFVNQTVLRRKFANCEKLHESSGTSRPRCLFAVLLLTGTIETAEQAVSEAIATSGCGVAVDELLVETAKCAIQIDDVGFPQAKIPSGLPPELRRLFLLSSIDRQCFVLRMLMGLTLEMI